MNKKIIKISWLALWSTINHKDHNNTELQYILIFPIFPTKLLKYRSKVEKISPQRMEILNAPTDGSKVSKKIPIIKKANRTLYSCHQYTEHTWNLCGVVYSMYALCLWNNSRPKHEQALLIWILDVIGETTKFTVSSGVLTFKTTFFCSKFFFLGTHLFGTKFIRRLSCFVLHFKPLNCLSKE